MLLVLSRKFNFLREKCLFLFLFIFYFWENNALSLIKKVKQMICREIYLLTLKREDYLMGLEDQELRTYGVFFLGKLKGCIILAVIGQWCEDRMSACIDMGKVSS